MDENYRVEVGKRLMQARRTAGFETAADAAKAFRWHPQNVRDHEAGRRGVDPQQADDYARRYKVQVQWLLYGRGEMKAGADTIGAIIDMLDPETANEVLEFARFKAKKVTP